MKQYICVQQYWYNLASDSKQEDNVMLDIQWLKVRQNCFSLAASACLWASWGAIDIWLLLMRNSSRFGLCSLQEVLQNYWMVWLFISGLPPETLSPFASLQLYLGPYRFDSFLSRLTPSLAAGCTMIAFYFRFLRRSLACRAFPLWTLSVYSLAEESPSRPNRRETRGLSRLVSQPLKVVCRKMALLQSAMEQLRSLLVTGLPWAREQGARRGNRFVLPSCLRRKLCVGGLEGGRLRRMQSSIYSPIDRTSSRTGLIKILISHPPSHFLLPSAQTYFVLLPLDPKLRKR